MAKRTQLKNKKNHESHAIDASLPVTYSPPPPREPLEPKTETQKRYMNAIKAFDVVIAVGPAGTGKTFLPVAMAADALAGKKTDKIIITRPVVDAGESLGFLPGELDEKYAPYLAPVQQVFNERLGKSRTEYELKAGKIEPIPLAYMRGMTFKNCWVILDEAQNTTPEQMKMFLTRVGEGCKVIICGDTDQKDIKGPSGLADAVARVSWIPTLKVIKFGVEDVVRSGFVMDVLKSYARES